MSTVDFKKWFHEYDAKLENDTPEGTEDTEELHEYWMFQAYKAGYSAGLSTCAEVCDDAHNLRNSSFQGVAQRIRSLK